MPLSWTIHVVFHKILDYQLYSHEIVCRRYCDESKSYEISLTRQGFINRIDDIRPRAEMAVPKIYELVVHPADGLGLAERANPKGQLATHVQDSRHYRAAFHQSKIGTLFCNLFDCFRSNCCHSSSYYWWNRWALFSFSLFTSSSFFLFFMFWVFNIQFIIQRNVDEWNVMNQVETVVWSFEATVLFKLSFDTVGSSTTRQHQQSTFIYHAHVV